MDKISMAVVRRFLNFLNKEATKDPAKYLKFYKNYSYYLKAGLIEDREFGSRHKDPLIKLLRFEATEKGDGEMISLDEYIDGNKAEQKNIYYFSAPNRETALASPYLEQFLKRGRNVLLFLDDIDEFVVSSVITDHKGKKLVSIDSQNEDFELELDADKAGDADDSASASANKRPELSQKDKDELETFLKDTLGNRIMDVKWTDRLVSSPAVITSVMTPHMRKMMKNMMQAQGGGAGGMGEMPMTLELAPKHELVKTLHSIKDSNPDVAKLGAECLFDNATIAAGLLDEPRNVLPRMNKMLEMFVNMGAGEDFRVVKEKMSPDSPNDDGGAKRDAEEGKKEAEAMEKLARENLENVQKAAEIIDNMKDVEDKDEQKVDSSTSSDASSTGVITEKSSTPHSEEESAGRKATAGA